MIIGIDASRAFLKRRTGIEEYAYQTIKHLRSVIPETDLVILYVRKKIKFPFFEIPKIDFELPKNWQVKGIWAPRFWTQAALSWEMFLYSPDVLFIPAHTVPFIHPRKTIVTIHGLEYEFCKDGYSFLARLYMKLSIRFSCHIAETVICVSENTKRDVMRLYGVEEKKIKVVYEGYSTSHSERSEESRNVEVSDTKDGIPRQARDDIKNPYLLFIGRLEERKNIIRIIEAFEMLKKKYHIPHQLILVGKPGYNYEKIKFAIRHSPPARNASRSEAGGFTIHIKELGYVSENKKWELLKSADVFLFPTLYEGFGIPILEAQSVGVPVVTSRNSSLPEVGGEGAIYVDPTSTESITEGVWKILSDKELKSGIIEKGLENVKRFSWQKCAKEIYESIKQ